MSRIVLPPDWEPHFNKIPMLIDRGSYHVDIDWAYLERYLEAQIKDGLDIDPDFQRGHVWTREQQIAFVEFKLRGGDSGGDLLTNCVGWSTGSRLGDYVLVDGKQRLHAVRLFLSDLLPAFGHLRSKYKGHLRVKQSFKWHVNELSTRKEVLDWYVELNAGGTPHTEEEIERVRELAEKEPR